MKTPPFLGLLEDDELPHGAIVGTVKISSCVRMTPTNIADFSQRRPLEIQLGDWQPGRYAWVLREPRLLDVEPLAVARIARLLPRGRGSDQAHGYDPAMLGCLSNAEIDAL
jgi:hypothetical protein